MSGTALAGNIEVAEHRVRSGTPGLSLYLRNKRRADASPDAGRIVLFVHGSTIPSEASFDLPLGGRSWMDILAAAGFDAWFVDIRGYGLSDIPPEMAAGDGQPPVVDTATAIADLATAVDFVLARHGSSQLNLIGWSWGTTIAGAFTAGHNGRVRRLILVAPQWTRDSPSTSDTGGALGPFRSIRAADMEARWRSGLPQGEFERLVPPAWLALWRETLFGADGARLLRAPNGTVADSRAYWSQGKAYYDPGQIRVPVLQVHAEWDADIPLDIARRYFAELKQAPYRRWIEIGEGTHSILLEKNRFQLFHAAEHFLREDFTPETA